nr:hypothetical protein [Solirubrobacterales bacterium]
MPRPKSDTLERLAELLALLFYALLAVALLAVFTGAAGCGLLLLILGGAAHVARVGVEGGLALR